MSDPQNPNDPFNQQSANQPWGQESANQPDANQWGQQQADPNTGQQPWGQQSASQPADQWGGQYGGQAPGQPIDPNAGQWGQQQHDPYAAQYGQQAAWAGGGQTQPPGLMPTDGKSFFSALFDFNFTSFVTPKIIKVVYIVLTVAIGLGVLFFIISSLLTRQPVAIIAALIIGPLVGLIYLALSRMTLELYYAVIRLSEDVNARLPRQ